MKFLYEDQQGDVIFRRINKIDEKSLTTITSSIIQEGEATGHAHRLTSGDYSFYSSPNNRRFLRVINPATITHEEHAPITLEPGEYEIGIVREYDPFEKLIRSVVD